jgi:hypothetical protein
MNNLSILCAVLCAAPLSLYAQDDKKQPPAAAMTNPKHPEHDALKAMVGNWDFTMKMPAMPGVPGMEQATESQGTEHAELTLGGLWLKSTINGTFKNEPFQGVWLAGYDPFQKHYISVFVSSDDHECGASTMDGQLDAKTGTWTWNGKSKDGEMRSVLTFPDANTAQEICYLKTPDGKEAKCMEITRKRSKAPAAAVTEASLVKASKPAAKEVDVLLQDVGEWDAIVKCAVPGQPAAEEKGTEKVTAICNGRWLWSDFKGQMMGQPFQGHGLVGFDADKKQYVSLWFDSMSPTFALTTGTFDAAGKTGNFAGDCVCPEGKPMTIQQVLTRKGEGTRNNQMKFVSGGETTTMEITYQRRSRG